MANPSPFPWLDSLLQRLADGLQPPPWMIEEIQRRMVLAVNHVLMQESEAQARLARQAGRVLEARWRVFVITLVATPAGLLDLAMPGAHPDLTLTVTDESPWALAQSAFRGEKPAIRIAGDVDFATEVNWLVDHVRWDLEEDLARIIGDAPAHAMSEVTRRMVEGLRQFARSAPGGSGPGSSGPGAPPPPPAA